MSYSIINEELRIQACSIEDLSQEDKDRYVEQFKGDRIETLSLFYDPVTDTVALNQDHENYEMYKIAAETFMNVGSKRRANIIKKTEHFMDKTNELLDKIARRRERLQKEEEARKIRRMLGHHPIDPYLKNVDMLGIVKGMDPDRYTVWDEYDTFVYGYIQGIRAERARRKKVAL